MSEIWHRVAPAAEIPAGRMQGYQVGDRDIVICNSRDGWFALEDVCTHAYARMHEGRLRGCRLICPLHGASFDIRDGSVLGAPATAPLATFPLRIVEDQVEIALPA